MADLAYLRRIAFSTKPVRHEHLRDALRMIDELRAQVPAAPAPDRTAVRLKQLRALVKTQKVPGCRTVTTEHLEIQYGCSLFDSLDSDDLESLAASGSVWLP